MSMSPNEFDVENQRFNQKMIEIMLRLKQDEIKTENGLLAAVFSALKELYSEIRSPDEVNQPLDEYDVRDEKLLNAPFEAAERNSIFLTKMHQKLQSSQRASFNYLSALSEMAQGRLLKGTSRSVDLKLLSSNTKKSMIVAGDDFFDSSKIDSKFQPPDPVELLPTGGGITIKRIGSKDLSNEVVEVKVEGPSGLYEGKKYGILSPYHDVDPEGNSFQFSTVSGGYQDIQVPGLSEELRTRFQTLTQFYSANPSQALADGLRTKLTPTLGLVLARSNSTFGGLTIREWEQISGNFHYDRTFTESRPDHTSFFLGGKNDPDPRNTDRSLDLFSTKTIITEGREEEKQLKRRRMLDGNPDTYWQCELVIDTSDEFNRWRFDDKRNQPAAVQEIEELTQYVQSTYDNDDRFLEVVLTLDFGAAKELNYISIFPVHFHPSQIPEIMDIQYSTDGFTYTSIPEVRAGGFEKRIAKDVNAILSSEEVAFSMTANKYDYRGKGFFAFDQIATRFIKIRIREQKPIPVIYHVLRLILERTTGLVKQKKTFGHSSTKRKVTHQSKDWEIEYPTTLQLVVSSALQDSNLGDADVSASLQTAADGLAGLNTESLGSPINRTSTSQSLSQLISGIIIGGGIFGAAAELFTNLMGSKKKITDSGWEIRRDPVLFARFDKARYAIGIRDITLATYTYAETGSFVSIPFRSPKPISTISLEVDENISTSLLEEATFPINYYFSIDDGGSWKEISPLKSKPRVTIDSYIPQIYHVNSGIPYDQRDANVGYVDTTTPAFQVRFRATLSRPVDNEHVSPILKSYRLKILTEEGL